MEIRSDLDIASEAERTTMKPISEIAAKAGISEDCLEYYGKYKAKVDTKLAYEKVGSKPDAKVILVTAINPTPAGEGKTTTTIGLSDALNRLGKRTFTALREPSLGPVFGVKGGATGGGFAQVIPMADINLHFTGDLHAIGAANNLIAAMLDNHIHHGNKLGIDVNKIEWKRAIDMNDRQLRAIVDGLGPKGNGVPREDGFNITVASEVMAVFCLADSITDLKARLARIVIAYSFDGKPVTVGDIKAQGAAAALLKDALKPNLVQTLEGNPVFIHGGPFANIAHGCNSVVATKLGMKLGDYLVTEAGFGADLGAEKFIDIKCRATGIRPSAVVLVATVRALKYNGGVPKAELGAVNMEALEKGIPNLLKHLENITTIFKLPVVVAINRFPTDTEEELEFIRTKCKELGANVALSEVWGKGGEGGIELAKEVMRLAETPSDLQFTYDLDMPIVDKINTIAKRVYGADGVVIAAKALKKIKQFEELGYGNLPICVAKTQYSLTDDQKKLGRPQGFKINVENITASIGAGFLVVYTGDIMTMPGLPKIPSAENIDVDENGVITGLF